MLQEPFFLGDLCDRIMIRLKGDSMFILEICSSSPLKKKIFARMLLRAREQNVSLCPTFPVVQGDDN